MNLMTLYTCLTLVYSYVMNPWIVNIPHNHERYAMMLVFNGAIFQIIVVIAIIIVNTSAVYITVVTRPSMCGETILLCLLTISETFFSTFSFYFSILFP